MRDRLLAIRRTRVPPGFDDKILADWNGLAIAALADAALLLDRPDWIGAAACALAGVLDRLLGWRQPASVLAEGQGRHPRHRRWLCQPHRRQPRPLRLPPITHLATASALAAALVKHHWNEERGGFAFASDEADHLIARPCYAQTTPPPTPMPP